LGDVIQKLFAACSLLSILAVAGCGGTRVQPVDATDAVPDVRHATTIAEVEGQACPPGADMGELSDGTCSCDLGTSCRGSMPEPPAPNDRGVWRCVPSGPDPRRADGCPISVATDGAPCDHAQTCEYRDCGGVAARAACEGETWHVQHFVTPMPMKPGR